MPRGVKITESLKLEIINYYKSNLISIKEISKLFNLSSPTIIKILKDTQKHSKMNIRNRNLNENYFKKIDDEYKAYFLGLLLTDGNVFEFSNKEYYNNCQTKISLTLKNEDIYILETFKFLLNSNTAISKDKNNCSNFSICSNKISLDLYNYGIVPNKSKYTYLPTINDTLMRHLIRGIFDGDGCIFIKNCRGSKRNNYIHSFSFCGSRQLMQDLSNYLYINLNLKQKPSVYDYKNRFLSEIKIQNLEDMYKFGEYIYNNSIIKLKRKYNKYLSLKKDFNLK